MRLLPVVTCLTAVLIDGSPAVAEPQPDSLVVVVKEAAPFVLRDAAGRWTGITVELIDAIAVRLGRTPVFRERQTLDSLFAAVQRAEVDIGAGALTITSDREERFDFSQPYHVTGLAIAVHQQARAGWLGALRMFASWDFLRIVAIWTTLLLLVGLAVWFFERRRNEQFRSSGTLAGILCGFWFSAVTMTTVGYGDKAPRTPGGRVVSLVWMFASLIIISGFTAAIASALTVGGLSGVVEGEDDLRSARVGTVSASASAAFLADRRIRARPFATLDAALDELAAANLDAVVYDAPLLRYLVSRNHPQHIRVLSPTLDVQLYGFALPDDSPLREPIDRAILDFVTTPAWASILFQWLGDT